MLSAAQYAGMAICASVPLNRLMQDMEMFKRLMEIQKQHTVLLFLIPNYQFARNMSLSTDHPLLLDGELMSETEFMATARATGNAPLIAFLLTMKVQLSSYFHDYMAGQQHAWALLRSDLSSLSPGTEANYLLHAGLVLAAIPQRRRRSSSLSCKSSQRGHRELEGTKRRSWRLGSSRPRATMIWHCLTRVFMVQAKSYCGTSKALLVNLRPLPVSRSTDQSHSDTWRRLPWRTKSGKHQRRSNMS